MRASSEERPDALAAARAFHERVRFAAHLGIRIEALADGRATLSLELRPEHLNSFGTAHGGVLMTLLDCALCQAARTQHPRAAGIVTLSMTTSFIAPATGRLLAEGRVLRPGRSTVHAEAEVRATDGTLVARALGTVRPRLAGA